MRLLLVLPLLITFILPSHRLEMPAVTSPESVYFKTFYVLQYNERFEQPDWVAYELTGEEVRGNTPRKDQFRSDPSIVTGSAEPSDYRKSGFDRGHLVPAADMKMSEISMSESFFMSNMSPQNPEFNRGIWRELEELVREWAISNDALLIVTGPVFDKDNYPVIGENRVAVPEYYFKVILDYTDPGFKALGFILPNQKSSLPLQNYAVTVDRVESVTGFDFYPLLPDDIEANLEQRIDISQWGFPDSVPGESELYWVNSNSGVRHIAGCRYYGKTSKGFYTTEREGEPCSLCGAE